MTPSSPKGETHNPRNWPVKSATSYGGVVVRDGSDGLEVALIRPKGAKKIVWALPKGAKEPGEDGADAALREVFEETGLGAEVVEALEPITYWYVWPPEQVRYRKTVRFYLMRYTGGEPAPDPVEVEEVAFFPLSEAPRKASYTSERNVLKQAADLAHARLRPDAPPTK
jgi:8-oxo-dGTP diphosphatase